MRSWPHAGIHLHVVVDRVQRRLRAASAALAVGARDRRVAVHPDEPLRRGEEDDRVVAAPAVRILMRELRPVPAAGRARLQRLLDVRVGVEHALPGEELDGVEEVAARADRA